MAIGQTAYPPDTVQASAPSYSFSGATANASAIMSAWNAACTAYETTARNNAPTLNSWTPTGTTSTGTAAPATPADTTFYGDCGTGTRQTSVLTGADGYLRIQHTFTAKKYRRQYRWVEDVAYIPAGWGQKISGNTDPVDSGCSSLNNYKNLLAAIYGNRYPTDADYLAASAYMMGYNGTTITGCASGRTYTINATAPGYASITSGIFAWAIQPFNYTTATNGQWHLEEMIIEDGEQDPPIPPLSSSWFADDGNEYTFNSAGSAGGFRPSPVQACGTANYVQISRSAEQKRGKSPRNISNLSGPMPTWSEVGVVGIGSECNGERIISSTSILDPSFITDVGSGDIVLREGYTITGDFHPAVTLSITQPGSNYILQQGSSFQGYHTVKGGYVFDLHLKKWGKYLQDYKCLVPLENTVGGYTSGVFTYDDVGMTAGLLQEDGLIYLFDNEPTTGFIRYGKIGYYRLGMVHYLETRIDFRDFATGSVRIDSSLDGRNLDPSVYLEETFTDVLGVKLYPNMRYRWYTITISGKYDLQYMESRGNISARR